VNLPSFVWGGGFFAVRKGGASERVVGHGRKKVDLEAFLDKLLK
jgi:hypothetical protein